MHGPLGSLDHSRTAHGPLQGAGKGRWITHGPLTDRYRGEGSLDHARLGRGPAGSLTEPLTAVRSREPHQRGAAGGAGEGLPKSSPT